MLLFFKTEIMALIGILVFTLATFQVKQIKWTQRSAKIFGPFLHVLLICVAVGAPCVTAYNLRLRECHCVVLLRVALFGFFYLRFETSWTLKQEKKDADEELVLSSGVDAKGDADVTAQCCSRKRSGETEDPKEQFKKV